MRKIDSAEGAAKFLNPLDAALIDLGLPVSGMDFPPKGWRVIQEWGLGYALANSTGLRAIVDVSMKADDKFWLHVSVSRVKTMPRHEDMILAKVAFIGDRYAYSVYPPRSEYVNIHAYCLHLWALVDDKLGQVLPEFSGDVGGVKSI